MLFNRNPLELRDDLAQNQNDDLFGRVRPNTKQDAAIADLSEPHKLSAPVGEQGQNQRRDVAKTELLLGHAGTLDLDQTEGPTGYWGERTRQATRAFQKQHRLKVDGRINPGGETIRALAKIAGGAIRAFSGQKMPAVTAPVPEPSPVLPDETIASNQRLARALAKRKGTGDLYRFTTDAINADPAKAIPEIVDLLHKVHANDPAQAQGLLQQTAQGIAPEHGQALHQAMQVSPTPGTKGNADAPVPLDSGQDDPEDTCAIYEAAVIDAEANLEVLETHADKLEQEIIDLVNQVNEKEQKKLQIQDTLLSMGINVEGAKYHPSMIVSLFNNAASLTEEEYKRIRENLQNDLNVLSDEVKKLRDKMHDSRKERQAMNSKIAYARGQLAQAQANLRRCEKG